MVDPKDVPILFNSAMVRAILDGHKTQTRRPVKLPPHVTRRKPPYDILFYNTGSHQYPGGHEGYTGDQPPGLLVRCSEGTGKGETTVQRIKSPFGIQGDRMWVRETFCEVPDFYGDYNRPWIDYRAGRRISERPGSPGAQHSTPLNWTPSIHMPRWASRINLRVKRIWVERLQDISEPDVLAEGKSRGESLDAPKVLAKKLLAPTWDAIYEAKGYGWSANPMVWCCEFEVLGHE